MMWTLATLAVLGAANCGNYYFNMASQLLPTNAGVQIERLLGNDNLRQLHDGVQRWWESQTPAQQIPDTQTPAQALDQSR